MSIHTRTEDKGMMSFFNKTRLVILGAFLIIAGLVFFVGKNTPDQAVDNTTSTEIVKQEKAESSDRISYQGESGRDALTILESIAEIEKDQSGLVNSINGRKADGGKNEFWAFYVNGGMSQVGPADYVTDATDEIEWKIERY